MVLSLGVVKVCDMELSPVNEIKSYYIIKFYVNSSWLV